MEWEELEGDYGPFMWFCPCGHSISFIEYTNEECSKCEREAEERRGYYE